MHFWAKNRNLIVSIAVMLVVTAVFTNSFYWPTADFSLRKLLYLTIIIAFMVVVPLIVKEFEKINAFVGICIDKMICLFHKLLDNWKKVLTISCSYIGASGLAYVVNIGITELTEKSYNPHQFYFFLALAYMAVSIFWARNIAIKKPEVIFVIVVLIMGLFFIRVTPSIVGISWDDEIHYNRTISLADFLNGVKYEADMKIMREYVGNIQGHLYYDRESNALYMEELESLYAEKVITKEGSRSYGLYSVAYIPGAIGIMLARGLGLGWEAIFMTGKFFNLLTYTGLFAMAMRKLKYGKMLVACIGLIPTSVFMASSYSYDFWVIGCIVLGFAYFFSMLQSPQEQIKKIDMIIMTGAILLGCLPKAVYFPILFPMLFLRKKMFKDDKQQKLLWGLVIGAGLLLVGSFLLPMLISGAGEGDYRGGADVNATEQIEFILSNPLQYLGIYLNFMKGYLSLDNGMGYTQMYAYLGNGKYHVLVLMVIGIMALWNKREERTSIPWIRLTGIIGVIGALVLVPTALYISFTPVAHSTILGCQYRYITPMLFPLLYLMCGTDNQKEISRKREVILPMVLIAMTFLENVRVLCVELY